MKHFKLRKDLSIVHNGILLYRIEATEDSLHAKKGTLGGFVESENNLLENAWVSEEARVSGSAGVSGNALVSGNAGVSGEAWVSEEARVSGSAWVSGEARVFGNARVSGNAWVSGNAGVSGEARVSGNAWVSGSAWVSGNAIVETKSQCINITNLKHNITITKNHIQIGCEFHTIEHWKKEIKDIGIKYWYTDAEIKGTILILRGALTQRGDLK